MQEGCGPLRMLNTKLGASESKRFPTTPAGDQSNNNLKQIGLGIQNFHDIRQEIVSAWLTTDAGVNGTANQIG